MALNRLRVVLDANVLVRGFAQRRIGSAASEIMRWWSLGVFDLRVNGVLIDEVARALVEEFGVPPIAVADIVATLADEGNIVALLHQRMGCRDANDDHVLETAFIANANIIVSCDDDLLHLPEHVQWALRLRGIQVMTDAAFLTYVRKRAFSPCPGLLRNGRLLRPDDALIAT